MAPCMNWVIAADQKERKSPPHQNGMFLSKLATVSNESGSITWTPLWVSLLLYVLLSKYLNIYVICFISSGQSSADIYADHACRPLPERPQFSHVHSLFTTPDLPLPGASWKLRQCAPHQQVTLMGVCFKVHVIIEHIWVGPKITLCKCQMWIKISIGEYMKKMLLPSWLVIIIFSLILTMP